MTPAENFYRKQKQGRRGEEFVCRNIRKIIPPKYFVLHISSLSHMAETMRSYNPEMANMIERIGGEDLFLLTTGDIDYSRPIDPEAYNQAAIEKGREIAASYEEDGVHYAVKDAEAATMEVKNEQGSFLLRDNNWQCPSGSIGFEVWSSFTTNKEYGWTAGYFHPFLKRSYLIPTYLTYVLTLDKEGTTPFATICWRWEDLAPRLNELAGGVLFPEWKIPSSYGDGAWLNDPIMKQFGSYLLRNHNGKAQNMWSIPLAYLYDIGRIVIWKQLTEDQIKAHCIEGGKPYQFELAKQRYNFLCTHAAEIVT